MKKRVTFFVLACLSGTLISLLQAIVLNGLPLKLTDDFWGEVVFAIVYVYFFIVFQRHLLRPILRKFRSNQLSVTLVIRQFLFLQLIGMALLFALAILLVVLTTWRFDFQLKDMASLRFIFVYYFFINSIIYGIGIGFRLYILYNREKDAKHQAEKSFMKAQLQMLRQQLNPHFLFNNLNIITSTIKSEPEKAYEFTRSMASFYRKVLESESAGWIGLSQEIKTIEAYLYMLSVRFEDKLLYTISIGEEEALRYQIPDFILQPLVENAIKHNKCSKASPLQLHISVTEGPILEIRNNFQPKEESQDGLGIGWFNIEARYKYLKVQEPRKFVRDGWFYVQVPLIQTV